MEIKERIKQVRIASENDHDAIVMLLLACADLGSEHGALLSVKTFGNAANHILSYFGKQHKLKKHLKLFVWTEFCPDYTDGLAFAIAFDEADAKKQIEKIEGHTIDDWGPLEIKPLSRRTAMCVPGGI